MKKSTSKLNQSVMGQIKAGQIKMRPRIYFLSLGVLAGAAIAAMGLTLAYLSSIIFWWWRIQNANGMAWGARNRLSEMMASFPWWALILAIVLAVAAILLVRRQSQMYRHKTSIVAAVIIAGAILVGIILAEFNIGRNFHQPMPVGGRGQGRWQQMK